LIARYGVIDYVVLCFVVVTAVALNVALLEEGVFFFMLFLLL